MKFNFKKNISFGIYILAVIPLSAFICMVFKYAVNIPLSDDFYIFIDPLINDYSISEKIAHYSTAFGNEHRTYTILIVNDIVFYLTSELNFRYLQIVGAFFYLLTFVVILFQSKNKSIVTLLVISLWMFQLNNLGSILWACTSIQYNVLMFSTVLFCYFLTLNPSFKNNFILVILSIVAIGSFGNGLLLIPIYFIHIFINKSKKSLILSIVFVLLFVLYFYGYPTLNHHPDKSKVLLSDTWNMIGSFFIYSTNIIYTLEILWLKLLGIILLFLVMYLTIVKKGYKRSPFWFYIILFCLGTFFMVSLSRTGIFNQGQYYALNERYNVFSMFYFLAIYFYFIDLIKFRKPLFLKFNMVICILLSFNFFTKFYYIEEKLIERQLWVKKDFDNKNPYVSKHNLNFQKAVQKRIIILDE